MSNQVTLKAELGRKLGSGPTRRLRREGKIPGVVYGLGKDPVPVAVDYREARIALTGDAGINAVLNLDLGDHTEMCLVKDLQHHLLRGEVSHLDFLRVDPDEKTEVEVPVVLTGEAREVTQQDGMVDQTIFHLLVLSSPLDIPNEIVADISDLEIGDSIRVEDLVLPAGVEALHDMDEAVATAMVTRSTLEALAQDEAEEEAAEEAAEEASSED